MGWCEIFNYVYFKSLPACLSNQRGMKLLPIGGDTKLTKVGVIKILNIGI